MSGNEDYPIWDHLEELAQRLRKILFTIIITTLVFSMLPTKLDMVLRLDFEEYTPIISLLMQIIQDSFLPEDVTLIALNWLDTFSIYILMSLIIGFIITLPYTMYHFFQFVSPALYPHERRLVYVFVGVSSILFALGVAYAWFILLPTMFNVLIRFVYQSGVMPFFSVADFFNIVAVGLIGSGIFYTFPLIIWILVSTNIIEIQTLKNNRRQIFIGLIILTAVLTPDPSPFSMLLLTIPFYILYEATIQVLGRLEDKKNSSKVEKLLAPQR
jgi:sec-independent protein translocase protein TatC